MRTILFLGVVVLASALSLQVARAQNENSGDLAKSAASLDEWLGSDANGQKWRDYLLLKTLRAEVAGDREADPAKLIEVWRRFASGEAGLEGKRFQAVRADLESYLNKRLQLSRSQVAALAKEVAGKYVPPAQTAITQAEAELRQAARAADAFVNRLPAAQRSHTRSYLGGQVLADWAANRPITDDQLQKLADALGKYKWRHYEQKYIDLANKVEGVNLEIWNDPAKVEGLEGAVYTRLRTAIERLQKLRGAAAEEDAAKKLQSRVEKLAELVQQAEAKIGADDVPVAIKPVKEGMSLRTSPLELPPALEAARILGELQATGQAMPLRQELFRGFSLPNVIVYSSGDLFGAGLDQEIDRVRPVNDIILGTSVHGTARVVGETRTQMLTNPLQAGYAINLGAVANSNTIGYNGPVTIYSTGVTQLHGQKKIHFDDLGGMRPSPATASATTCTSINDICARSRLVTRIAWKRALASKGEAEGIASARAAANLREEMDQQATESTTTINKNFQQRYRNPLIIRGEYPRQFLTASSSKQMQVAIAQLSQGQLGAPTAPPPAPAGDIVVQIHESFVANYGRAMFGGQTFSALEVRQMMEQLGAKVPSLKEIADERQILGDQPEEEAVVKLATSFLTFDSELPLRAEFRGNHVLFVLRIEKAERTPPSDPASPTLEEAFRYAEISALYRIEREFPGQANEGDFVLRRDKINEDQPRGQEGREEEEPIVDRGVYSAFLVPPKANAQRARIALRNFTNRFRRDAFPVEIKLGPMNFAARQGGEQSFGNWSKLDPLPTTTAKASGGWLQLAWTMQPWKFQSQRPESAGGADEKPADKQPAEEKKADSDDKTAAAK
jgi:hypothetical protein